jgi:hydroxymethylpyrimidine/phosphomethylpyrimidine kinase
LVAAGLDPSGRAGLIADAEAIRASGAAPLTLATALTAQGARTFAVDQVSPRMFGLALSAALELGEPHAVKVGMAMRAQLRVLRRRAGKSAWVVDPVTRTSRDEPLSDLAPGDYLRLGAPNVILTPNLPELAWLTGMERPLGPEGVLWGAEQLLGEGFGAVVVKGGHARPGVPLTDFLVTPQGATRLISSWLLRSEDKRGTGCRFASALAAELAEGRSLRQAVMAARAYVRSYLKAP